VLEVYDPRPAPLACPRRPDQSPTLTLIQTRDRTRIPLPLGPTPTHHLDLRVHAQGRALVRPTVKGDVEGALRRRVVEIADVEPRIGGDVTRVKIHLTMADGDDSRHTFQGS